MVQLVEVTIAYLYPLVVSLPVKEVFIRCHFYTLVQRKFSSALSAQQATRPELRELQAWISGHLEENLSVPVLAERALMSERSFTRAFHREVGQTPAAYVETLRIEQARDLLEDGAPSLEAVAQASGFASAEVLRRAFHRHLGVSPAEYRDRFQLSRQ